ncbi:MAG TPA: 2-dehydropantoate 2-reductase N-terminal domain-containing protein [Gemmatimonadales bacterium]|nr:2-dehydropantoate 2-reductase N-terminal domain-containing protein [Gemmatimonadales bacterium]
MRILVVGAGVIGAIYGWALSAAGHDVTHLVRPGRASTLSDGLAMDVLDKRGGHARRFRGRYALRPTETIAGAPRFDLVIVPVKHYRLMETLEQVVPLLPGTEYVLLTQNWKGSSELESVISPSHFLFGDAKAGGGFKEGTLVATIKGIDLGQVNSRRDECLQRAIALFRSASIRVTVQDDILHYLWIQYAINGGLWPAVVRAGGVEAALGDGETADLGLRAVRECLEVVARRGVDLDRYQEAHVYLSTSFITKHVAGMALRWMFRHSEYVKRNSVHALSDPQEIKVFYDDLVGSGRELGVPMAAMSSFGEDIRTLA